MRLKAVNKLKDKIAIVGLGWTKFSRNSGVSVQNLALESCKNAIDDAGLTVKDVDGIATYNIGDAVSPYVVATGLGLPELRWNIEYFAGANGATSTLLTAACAVIGGLADTVLVFRAMNGRTGTRLGGAGLCPLWVDHLSPGRSHDCQETHDKVRHHEPSDGGYSGDVPG
jgi:acetyl-CoA acetyltransferase